MAIALPDSLPDSLSLDAVACSTQSLLDTLVGLSPGWLQPAESLIGSDVVSLLRLQVSAESVLRLGVRDPALPGQARVSAVPVCPPQARMSGTSALFKARSCCEVPQYHLLRAYTLTSLARGLH